MSPEQWADLDFEIDQSGSPALPLSWRQLSLADYMRRLRQFVKVMTTDPATKLRVETRRAELQGAPSP